MHLELLKSILIVNLCQNNNIKSTTTFALDFGMPTIGLYFGETISADTTISPASSNN